MSDINSSLPIRTQNNGDVAVKVVDGTLTSQQLTVNADGSVNVTDNGQSLTVDSTDFDIRDLVFASDKVDVSGSTVTVNSTDLDIRDLDASQDNVAISDGTDQLAVNTDGSINVVIVDATPDTNICDYNTAAAVAGAASSTHTYTATADFELTQIHAAASGKMKIVVAANGNDILTHFNSTANPNIDITLSRSVPIAASETITIIRTNLEVTAQDVYSTIIGFES